MGGCWGEVRFFLGTGEINQCLAGKIAFLSPPYGFIFNLCLFSSTPLHAPTPLKQPARLLIHPLLSDAPPAPGCEAAPPTEPARPTGRRSLAPLTACANQNQVCWKRKKMAFLLLFSRWQTFIEIRQTFTRSIRPVCPLFALACVTCAFFLPLL